MRLSHVFAAALTATAVVAAPTAALAAPNPEPMTDSSEAQTLSAASAEPLVARVAGKDRIATAVEISWGAWDGVGGEYAPDAVLLARSDSYADSLAAAPLAVVANGPLLLTAPGSLPTATRNEISRVLRPGGTVYLLGGTSAISKSIADSLGKTYAVKRLHGPNRYATAVSVAKEVDRLTGGGVGSYTLTTGLNFPDGLAAGAGSGTYAIPVLLTADKKLPAETKAFLDSRKDPWTVAVGGAAAAAGKWNWTLAGKDRYETSALVAEHFFGEDDPDVGRGVGVATGANWPDALAGSAAMAGYNSPLLLAKQNDLTAPSVAALKTIERRPSGGVEWGVVFGGKAIVSDRVLQQTNRVISER